MWELDYKESWALKNWCFWTVVLEKTLESPLDCKEIQPVHFKGNQSWVFFERNDAKVETPILWPPYAKSWLIGKDSDAGRDWGRRSKGTTGWDGWIASLIQWTWVWVNSGSWWWTGKPGVLRFMGLQRIGHDWATELNWRLNLFSFLKSWADNSSKKTSIHINCFGAGGWHTSFHPILKMHIVGDGSGETRSALRHLSYMINSFLTDRKHPAKD